MMNFKIRTVMLIDDNPIDNLINRKILESVQYAERIIVMQSAIEALGFLLENKDVPEILPDVIFLDISMPQMDGFEFLRNFEKLDDHIRSRCKIVMLSSSLNYNDLVSANSNKYISRFLNKPLSRDVVRSIELN